MLWAGRGIYDGLPSAFLRKVRPGYNPGLTPISIVRLIMNLHACFAFMAWVGD
jgi:hypothetical protein